jgi:hypothetical protein
MYLHCDKVKIIIIQVINYKPNINYSYIKIYSQIIFRFI